MASRIVLWAAFALFVVLAVRGFVSIVQFHPLAVDIEIPLRAVERWLDGGVVYDPAAFDRHREELPFLYPPVVLPFVAPLLWLPRAAVHLGWIAILLVACLLTCRRLGLPPRTWPLAVVWPPFAEPIFGGNVQVLLVAAFVFVFWPPSVPAGGPRRAVVDGLLATLIGALKVSQFHPWLSLLRHRPRAALQGAAIVLGVCVVTLPLLGGQLWFDWLGQAARAGDPAWPYVGGPLSRVVGQPAGLAVTALTGVLALLVPWRHAATWVGVLVVLGSPSLHVFGFLFLLPALVTVRRDVALVVAGLLATYAFVPIWIGVALLVAALLWRDLRLSRAR